MEENCIFCKHIHWSNQEYDWSEVTPGQDFTCECGKGHWSLDTYNDTLTAFRRMLCTAEICPDYVFFKDTKGD